ncbi:glycosyltransferase [bacterium]|nr:glycosyltransferase [bacterium]
MSKPRFVISSPFDTYSGYGARSRDVIKSIIKSDKYKVELLSQRWGTTLWGFCQENPEWSFLLNHLASPDWQKVKPEIWMQITIPNEFQPVGKYNIGCTAGIETTACQAEWIQGLNRMDINWVSSKHSKKIFEQVKYTQTHPQTKKPIGEIKLEKPIEVVFEGANLDIYKQISSNEIKNVKLDNIKESFCYLFVGHWMQGEFGHDRKNVGKLVKAFLEIFKNKQNKPALILKTTTGVTSYISREEILNKINILKKSVNSKDLPNIYILNGDFTDSEMNEVYNNPKVKAMVSLTKGEGYGRPLLEFGLTGKPIIASGWSGQIDFLHKNNTYLIPGKLEHVHDSAANKWLIKESKWFQAEDTHIGQYFEEVYKKYNKALKKSKKQIKYVKNNFSWIKMDELINNILNSNIPEFPKQVQLNLPELSLPKLEKI